MKIPCSGNSGICLQNLVKELSRKKVKRKSKEKLMKAENSTKQESEQKSTVSTSFDHECVISMLEKQVVLIIIYKLKIVW